LIWLVNGAGVMVERDDETLVFAHLGFQEYLCAWKFAGEMSIEAQIERCRSLGQDSDWWETLRLWAAIVEARNSEHLVALVDALRGEAQACAKACVRVGRSRVSGSWSPS